MELKYNEYVGGGHKPDPPNCTLVELKFCLVLDIPQARATSKLYLSGIEIWFGGLQVETVHPPNCTLVELKFLNNVMNARNARDSKLYLSGIEIKTFVSNLCNVHHSKLYLSGIEMGLYECL